MAADQSTPTPKEKAAGAVLQTLAGDAETLMSVITDCIDLPPAELARNLAAMVGRMGLVADRAAQVPGCARRNSDDDWLFDGSALAAERELAGAYGG